MEESTRDGYVRLPAAAIADLSWALAHGLHAIAEVERSRDEIEHGKKFKILPAAAVDDITPMGTFTNGCDMSRYAEALIWLTHAEPVAE